MENGSDGRNANGTSSAKIAWPDGVVSSPANDVGRSGTTVTVLVSGLVEWPP